MKSTLPPPVVSRKAIIFKEAARLFREKGYSGSTLRELAGKAGVKGGSVYHHFSSKQEILFTIMEHTMSTLIMRVQEAIATETKPIDKLRKAIQFHIAYHTADSDETFVTDAELRSLDADNLTAIVGMRDHYERIFRQIMEEGVARGEMQIGNVRLASKALLQMCTGISSWYRPEGEKSISDIADYYIELFFRGISRTSAAEAGGRAVEL